MEALLMFSIIVLPLYLIGKVSPSRTMPSSARDYWPLLPPQRKVGR